MKKPNLVYILADDMGWGDVSCLNPHSAFQTPNFDRLGTEGAIFTDAHATSALCTPSRYGILTGRYNWRSRLKSGALGGYSSHLIEPGRLTVAQMLREQGYATGCIGKWHLGMDWTLRDDCSEEERSDFLFSAEHVDFSVPVKNGPIDCGFDSFFGISASLDIPPYVYLENDHPTALPDHEYPGTDGLLLARRGACAPDFRHEEVLPLLTQKARAFITDHREEPFFLYFPMPSPHTPVLPAPEFVGKSHTNAYGDYCLMCDDVVGQILEQLRLEGLEENTIVIYTSDNGCAPFVNLPELLACGHNPSAWFRGYKSDIFEGGHRIPLLAGKNPPLYPGGRHRLSVRPDGHHGGNSGNLPSGKYSGGQRQQSASVAGPFRPGSGIHRSSQRRRFSLHPERELEAGNVPRFRRLEFSGKRNAGRDRSAGNAAVQSGKRPGRNPQSVGRRTGAGCFHESPFI